MMFSGTSTFVTSVREMVVGLRLGVLKAIGGEPVDAEWDDEDKDDEAEVVGFIELSRSDAAKSGSMSSESSAGSALVALALCCLPSADAFACLPPFFFFLFVIPV
jgi:hypothetical protein